MPAVIGNPGVLGIKVFPDPLIPIAGDLIHQFSQLTVRNPSFRKETPMGEDLRSATELVYQVIADLRPMTEVLSPQDHSILAEFTEYALNDQSAIVNTASLLPLESTLLVVLLEEHKRTQRLYDELCTEIERLKMVAQRLEEIVPLGKAGL